MIHVMSPNNQTNKNRMNSLKYIWLQGKQKYHKLYKAKWCNGHSKYLKRRNKVEQKIPNNNLTIRFILMDMNKIQHHATPLEVSCSFVMQNARDSSPPCPSSATCVESSTNSLTNLL